MTVEVQNGRIKGYLSIEEIAKKNGVKAGAIRQMIRRGQIDTLQIGKGHSCLHFISETAIIPKRTLGRPKKDKEE